MKMYNTNKKPDYLSRLNYNSTVPARYSIMPGHDNKYMSYDAAPVLDYKSTINHVRMYI